MTGQINLHRTYTSIERPRFPCSPSLKSRVPSCHGSLPARSGRTSCNNGPTSQRSEHASAPVNQGSNPHPAQANARRCHHYQMDDFLRSRRPAYSPCCPHRLGGASVLRRAASDRVPSRLWRWDLWLWLSRQRIAVSFLLPVVLHRPRSPH